MINKFKDLIIDENYTISQEQLKNAVVFSNRWDWLNTLPKGISVAEFGVAAGDYSNAILNTVKPKSLYLIDLFDQSDLRLARPNKALRYMEGENLQFIVNKFKNHPEVIVLQSDSRTAMPDMISQGIKFDLVYLDTEHDFDLACTELEYATELINENGIIAINDYTHIDDNGRKYGIIESTNKFLAANKDWEVIGLALERRLYMDVYLRRKTHV